MSETVIRVEHVRKTYRSYKNNFQRVKHMLILSSAGEKNRVLTDVSFEIKKGEKVTIFTPSGGGKSTLLRILADIIKPEAGTVEVKGEPKLILDYRAGFDVNLTGLQNYRIRSKIEGWSDETIKAREKEIFKLAGLSHEKETRLKYYPRGGASRLGFAILTAETGDIILMDERISFGSTTINDRYTERFSELISPETTLVMAGNDFKTNLLLCERGIVIHEGKVVFDGPIEEALEYHKAHSTHTRKNKRAKAVEVENFDADDGDDAF